MSGAAGARCWAADRPAAGGASLLHRFDHPRRHDGNPADTPTFGTQTVLVASARQPDDLAYAVVKAVMENFADFHRLHPALRLLEKKDTVPSETVMPIHPGALRYYREAGLLR
jgi:uncharacterized protein